MPVFGNSDFQNVNNKFSTRDRIAGGRFMMGPEYGRGVSITLYGGCLETPHTMKCALYVQVSESEFSLVANSETEPVEVQPGSWYQEITFNFTAPGPLLLPNTEYLIVTWGSDVTGGTSGINTYTDPGLDFFLYFAGFTYDGSLFPDSIILGGWNHHMPAIYCTYDVVAPDCTNPAGFEGQLDECGAGPGTNQPSTIHKYLCTGGSWLDQGENCPFCPDCVACEDIPVQSECLAAGCFWYNGSCHTNAPICEQIDNLSDCGYYGCYWWDGACHSSPEPQCEDYITQAECLSAGCYWYNGACHTTAPSCEILDNQFDCSYYGCFWYDSACHSSPQPCEDIVDPVGCANAGCYWWNGSCHANYPTCEQLNNQTDCSFYNCYWWASACHSSPQPCEDIIDSVGCANAGCYWYNESCHSSPEGEEVNWLVIMGAAFAAVVVGGAIIYKIAKKK